MIRITEGSAEFFVPEKHSSGGPGKREGVFFNEQMAFNRDVSVMLMRSVGNGSFVDCMSATGARAVRIAKEVPSMTVIANDRDPKAFEYIERNIMHNELQNCTGSNRDMNSLLGENVYDVVDLDPFGSPIPFLDSAVRGCRRNGILAITATDTAPLAGAHRAKCERRYGSRPMRGPMCHEFGLRILMSSIAKELAKFDRGMEPILSFYADHYFRTYVRVKEGASNADDSLSNLVHMSYDPATLQRRISEERDQEHPFGPVWGGSLHNVSILRTMCSDGMSDERRCRKMLDLWTEELDHIPVSYDVSEVASLLKVASPKMETLLETIGSYGNASRSHTSPMSFRTDLDVKDMMNAFREASSKGNRPSNNYTRTS